MQLDLTLARDYASTLPLLWLVNICWPPCGFCQAMDADWARLARRLRHEAVVSHWDAARDPNIPTVLGEANQTPTIRAIVPAANGAQRKLVDYHGTRRFPDLLRFSLHWMPDYVARVESLSDVDELEARVAPAPRLLCFLGISAEADTPPLLKALSSRYRDRALIVDVRVHETAPAGATIAARFGVSALPSVVALRGPIGQDGLDSWRHKGQPTLRRLSEFVDRLLDAEHREGSDEEKDEL